MRTPVPFAGGSIISDSLSINNQLAQNWFPVSGGKGAKSQISMKPTPGLKSLGWSAGVGPVRTPQGIVFQDKCYFVSRDALIEIDSGFTAGVAVGGSTLNSSSGFVDMAASPTELLIVDGTDGYIFDGTNLTQIADPDFPAATTCTWLDFRFIVNVSGTGQFQISALNDGTDWDALDFATAESVPDDIMRVWATTDTLYLIGETSTELYFNSGNVDFTFDQRSNGVIAIGTKAPFSLAENEAGELVFVTNTERGQNDVAKLRGASFSYITDADTARRLDDYGDLSGASAWIYSQGGHNFYVLNVKNDEGTICYDFREGYWHDRKTYNLSRHQAGAHAFFNSKHVVADYNSSAFYEYDQNTYDDNGEPIVRTRRGLIVHEKGLNVFVSRFECEFEPGVGLVLGQGVDPQAMLRYSRNGKTWSNDLFRDMGKLGEYDQRVAWDALGYGKQFVFEVSVSDPVPAVLVAAYMDVDIGDA